MGIFQGKSGKKWNEAIAKSGLSEKEFQPEGGENADDAYDRAKRFFEKLKREKYSNILVVSHSGFISDMCTIILKESQDKNAAYKSENCAITFFEFDKESNVKSYCINNIDHLK